MAIFLPSGSSSENSLLPKFEEANIKVWELIGGEYCEEAILLFNEIDIHKVHNILKFMKMGSKQQIIDFQNKQKKKLERQKLKEESKSNDIDNK